MDAEKQALIDRVMELLAEEDVGPLELSEWVKIGVMNYRRSALPVYHPESWPSRWKAHFGEEMPFSKWSEAGLGEPWAIEFWADVEPEHAYWCRHAQLYPSFESALEQYQKDEAMLRRTGEQFKGKVFRIRNLATEQSVVV